MNKLQTVFQTYGPTYLATNGAKMPSHQRKALEAILRCQTIQSGYLHYHCDDCASTAMLMRSCGNRNCPLCQHAKAQAWLSKQLQRELPTHYFMITFTVPEQMRRFIRQNQKVCYNALFSASSKTLKKFLADPKVAGGNKPGFFGVLHSWGSQLHYHPHIHYVVPGGALADGGVRWVSTSQNYFAHYKNLSTVFKGIFREIMTKTGLIEEIPASVWTKAWSVNTQAVGRAENTLRYLGGYVFRVAISNHRIVKIEDGRVFFRYKKKKSERARVMSLDGMEFIRRFLQHCLPVGFTKVRYYGFYSGASSIDLEEVRGLIELAQGFAHEQHELEALPQPDPVTCPQCKTPMRYVDAFVPWKGRLISVKSLAAKKRRKLVDT